MSSPSGEGDYWLDVAAIGFIPRRLEIKRVADEEILLGDVRLTSSIATLDAVNVSANAPRALPARTDVGSDISGTDRTLATASLSADVAGNLAVGASLLPGIQLIPGLDGAPDVFSALGIGAEQNTTTFNGLGSSLTVLPRDAQTVATVRTFNYDPGIGGFGGAQIAVTTRAGSNFFQPTGERAHARTGIRGDHRCGRAGGRQEYGAVDRRQCGGADPARSGFL